MTSEAIVLATNSVPVIRWLHRLALPKAFLLVRAKFWHQSTVENPQRANVGALISRKRGPAVKSHVWMPRDIRSVLETRVSQIKHGEARRDFGRQSRWEGHRVLTETATPLTLPEYEHTALGQRVSLLGLTSVTPSHRESPGSSDFVVSSRLVVRVDSARMYCW
jgi:hypothetical protein